MAMCSNYTPSRREELERYQLSLPTFEYGEAYPGRIGPTLTNELPGEWVPAVFGLLPHWADLKLVRSTYNARTETVAERASFRNAWRKRQLCVVPAECIFEPCYETGSAVRWRIERADRRPMMLAGLFEHVVKEGRPSEWSMTMLTINAENHPLMSRFHAPGKEKRSVVVLEDDQIESWLGARAEDDVRQMLQLFDPEIMTSVAAPEAPRARKVKAAA